MIQLKQWRKLCESMQKGEEVHFLASSQSDIDSIRSNIHKWNFSYSQDWCLGVETKDLAVCIYTKPKL